MYCKVQRAHKGYFEGMHSHDKKFLLHLVLIKCALNKIISSNVHGWIHLVVLAHHWSPAVMDPKHTNKNLLL